MPGTDLDLVTKANGSHALKKLGCNPVQHIWICSLALLHTHPMKIPKWPTIEQLWASLSSATYNN